MTTLDRLGWTAGAAFDCYGVRVGVRVTDERLWPRLLDRVPPGATRAVDGAVDRLYSLVAGGPVAGSAIRRFHVGYDGHTRVAKSLDLDEALDELEASVRHAVATESEERLFVHAGVVGWRGRAIVVPAPSHSGKTRLVDALVKAGATYYSDEYAVVDHDGLVHPFAKPLSVRASGEGPRRRYLPTTTGQEPLRAGTIVVTSFEDGAAWRPERMTPGESVMALLANTVRARLAPEVALPILGRMVQGAEAMTGKRGGAEETAAKILETVG